ncbi:CHASE domain-containing protein [Kiloniella laminariae]|uniref:histidine kinase n=1 Tax=Kiloniella laminariae TaxID=454162 RepID=A0ABT4LH80_9PROT|nr:CHASE domain-containing protein [Kiloniella laminariae]MCZ4279706.1 CHASE domain-containing protein [Kiloniella laminariae]
MDGLNEARLFHREQRSKYLRGTRLHWAHWCVVFLSIILTVSAWYISDQQVLQRSQEKFTRESSQVIELVKERMGLYENALWGGVAFIDANGGDVSYDDWFSYASSLRIEQVFPGINGIGVIYNIDPSRLDSFLEQQRVARPDFALHPQHTQPEYWPITYIEPEGPNKRAVGLDVAFEANRYSAINKARDSGKAQITAPIALVQDASSTPGFLFYTPFYRNGTKPASLSERHREIVGVTYAPFTMYKLMEGILDRRKRQLLVKISDQSEQLFDDIVNAREEEINQDPDPLFRRQEEVAMYGRAWTFDIESDLSFRESVANSQPAFILTGGLIIDSLLFGFFVYLARGNRRALSYAEELTVALDSLKEQSVRLEKSNADLEQFTYVASHDLKAPLNSIKQIVGWLEEDCQDVLPEESKKHLELLTTRCTRMMKLLTDLLEYARIDRREYSDEPIILKDLTRDILFLLGVEDRFICEVPEDPILIPRSVFDVVLRNLISNAIKHHHDDHGKIVIRSEIGENGRFFYVEDDGPGIPDDLHSKALEMFQTLKPRDQVEGSGMGLALVKKLIEYHGGYLSLETGRKVGTCIVIFWPHV